LRPSKDGWGNRGPNPLRTDEDGVRLQPTALLVRQSEVEQAYRMIGKFHRLPEREDQSLSIGKIFAVATGDDNVGHAFLPLRQGRIQAL
jgi:hypothetical protein